MMAMDQVGQIILNVCATHRQRYRINEMPMAQDCEFKPCKTGCPIKRMPDALTPEDYNEAEKEVWAEEIQRKREEMLELKKEEL